MAFRPGEIPALEASRATGLHIALPITEYGAPADVSDWTLTLTVSNACGDAQLVLTGTPDTHGSKIAPDGNTIAIDIFPASLTSVGDPEAHQETHRLQLVVTYPDEVADPFVTGSLIVRAE